MLINVSMPGKLSKNKECFTVMFLLTDDPSKSSLTSLQELSKYGTTELPYYSAVNDQYGSSVVPYFNKNN